LPNSPRWVDGWQLGKPDLVVGMPAAFELPSDGPDLFRNFVIPVSVDEIRYVRAIEFHPGATNAVHHATILLDRTPSSRQRSATGSVPGFMGSVPPTADYPDGRFLGWAPGQQVPPWTRDLSWRLNPGSDFVVQLHLKPTGRVERIQATIGLFFTQDAPERKLSLLRLSSQNIDIASGQKDHVVTDAFVLPVDVEVYAVQPHAHYRAQTVEGLAHLPDGTTQWLVRIRGWDFNWQDMYYYREPLHLPKGTRLSMRYTFDNSAENPHNPQVPPRRVRWGPTSSDEMADLAVQLAPRSPADWPQLERQISRKHRRDDIAGRETLLSATPAQSELHEDVAQLYIEDGNIATAITHFREAVRLTPDSATRHAGLGRALALAGRVTEASAEYERSLALNPADVAAHNGLGVLFVLQGRVDSAMIHYHRALEIDPDYAEAHNNLATLLLYFGRAEEASDHARRALTTKPDLPEAHYNMARAMLSLRQPDEASRQFGEALRLRPDWPTALKDHAWMLATHQDPQVRDPRQAIVLAEHAVALTNRRQPVLLDVLAAAYAAQGDFDRAAATVRAALSLVTKGEPNTETMKQRLGLYLQRKSYVQDAASTPPH
jgi:Flp pilus assembly protein TadD